VKKKPERRGPPPDFLKGLNPDQLRAVTTLEGPVLVLAGAGSGKTRVITCRIAHLLSKGVSAKAILAVTFTNKAAREMRERVGLLVGAAAAKELTVSTFHSFCVRLLREHAELLGLSRQFSITDDSDQLSTVKGALRELRIAEARVHPRAALSAISLFKNRLVSPEQALDQAVDDYDELIARAFKSYNAHLRRSRTVDFDDLLLHSVELLSKHGAVRDKLQDRYRYLMVDEYQDTNGPQYEILRLLAGKRKNLCVVGDDDQCLVRGTRVTLGDGSERAIEGIRTGDWVRSSYGSGDFRPARVLRVTERRGRRMGIGFTLQSGERLVSTPEHTHFAGYRLGIVPQLHFTYLMSKKGVGWRLGTSQVYTAGQKKPMVGFMQRMLQEHADELWVVGTHSSENKARLDECILSLRFGIPTLPFVPRRGGSTQGLVHDPAYRARVFSSLDTQSGARRLLAGRGLSPDEPHHRARSRDSRRRNVTITLCGDRRGRTPMHRISMVGNDPGGKARLEALGLSVRPAKIGSASWRFESAHKDFGALPKLVKGIGQAFDINLLMSARLGANSLGKSDTNSLPFTSAHSIMPGMAVFTKNGGYGIVEKVEPVRLRGSVYDLDVEGTHNFVANGILTHNSIYGWRGADVKKILNFEHDFKGATVIRLETNYRSTPEILEAANAVIRNNRSRHEKTLRTSCGTGESVRILPMEDEEHESQFVVDEILRDLRAGRAKASDFAVLFRTAIQPRTFEARLRSARIPYELVGGMSFFDRKEVRDVLAYLRLAANPHDEASLLRVINVPPRGVGKSTIERVVDLATHEGITAGEAFERAEVPPDALHSFSAFRGVLADFARRASGPDLAQSFRDLLLAVNYKAELDRCYEDAFAREARGAAVGEIVNMAENYARRAGKPTLQGFLEEVTLSEEETADEKPEAQEAVTLMTLHAAKGLEFPRVYLVGVEEGLLPHARSVAEDTVEEERRLMYVGITRARRHLTITRAKTRAKYGRREACLPSRFLFELKGETPPFALPAPGTRGEKEAPKPGPRRIRT
jgi:DNA helicase-2/ATP-dependent DNA helicase PcrA